MDTRIYHELYKLERDYWWHKAKRTLVIEQIRKSYQGKKTIKILDAGCGTGIVMAELQTEFPNTFGVDNSLLALSFCKKRGVNNVKRGNLEKKLPFKANYFDVITCLDVIEHLDKDKQAINEMRRVLKPHGKLFVTVPAFMFLWTKHDEMLWHKRRYTRRELVDRVKQAGFKVTKASYFYSFIAPLAFLLYKMKFMFNTRKSKSSVVPPKPINWLLEKVCEVERRVINFTPLPFGISIFLEAEKNID